MHLPRAAFWRMWLVAALFGGAALLLFISRPARAETMRASFYGSESGHRTASGAAFRPMGLTAAHRTLPLGTRLRVCFKRCAIVTVNDRGPAAWTGRALDLSRGAARVIGLEAAGVANLQADVIGHGASPRASRRQRAYHRSSLRMWIGHSMPTYTAKQIAVAKAMHDVYAKRYGALTCAVCLGCNDGEFSFLLGARGDHDEAGGAGQWHRDRQQIILKNTGIDVWTAGAADQAKALMAEISEPWSAYRHVEAALTAAPDIPSKMAVMVARFEQSGSQARDIARRSGLAEYWLAYAKQNWSAAA